MLLIVATWHDIVMLPVILLCTFYPVKGSQCLAVWICRLPKILHQWLRYRRISAAGWREFRRTKFLIHLPSNQPSTRQTGLSITNLPALNIRYNVTIRFHVKLRRVKFESLTGISRLIRVPYAAITTSK